MVVRSVRPVSTMWRCLFSAKPLCSGVWGGEVRWLIPLEAKKSRRAMNSPPLSENKVPTLTWNLFSTREVKRMNVSFTWDFKFEGVKPYIS